MARENEFNNERETVGKEQVRLQGERQRTEKLFAEERTQADKLNKERLQRESEKRRKEQNDRKEHLKQVEEMRRQRQKELADREVGGGKDEHGREVEQHLAKGRQLDIQANKEGRGAKQEQPFKVQEHREPTGIEQLRAFEKLVQGKVEKQLQVQEKAQEMSRTR